MFNKETMVSNRTETICMLPYHALLAAIEALKSWEIFKRSSPLHVNRQIWANSLIDWPKGS